MPFTKGHKINVGRKHSKAYGERISNLQRGVKLSELTKRRISESRKGKTYEEIYGAERALEQREKRRIAHLGKKYPVGEYPNKGTRNKKWGNHSQETRIKISAHQQNISVEDWKGFKLSKNRLLKNTAQYQIWRNKIFLRDNFTCQNPDCKFCNNEQGVYLQAHHKKPLSLYPELVFVLNNGITYCKDFHLKSGLHKNMSQIMMREGVQDL